MDGFGDSKEYALYFLNSDEEPLFFVHRLSQVLKCTFAYLDDTKVDFDGSQVSFPRFYAPWGDENRSYVLLMANKRLVPVPLELQQVDPLMGLSLFDEAVLGPLYLFGGKKGRPKRKGSSKPIPPVHVLTMDNFDYLMVVVAEKDKAISKEVLDRMDDSGVCVFYANDLFFSKQDNKKMKHQDFMVNMLVNAELHAYEYRERHLKKFLCDRIEVPTQNYNKVRRFGNLPISLRELQTNKYYRREDI